MHFVLLLPNSILKLFFFKILSTLIPNKLTTTCINITHVGNKIIDLQNWLIKIEQYLKAEHYTKDLSKSTSYPNKQHKHIQNIRMTEFTYSQIVNFPSKSLVLSLSILELDISPYNYFLWRIKAHKPVQSNVLYLRSHKHWILISESERNKLPRDSARQNLLYVIMSCV